MPNMSRLPVTGALAILVSATGLAAGAHPVAGRAASERAASAQTGDVGPGDARTRAAATIDAMAVPANTPVVLDGLATEPFWEQAPTITQFVQREPTEGAEPSFKTEGRIAYDSTALYVMMRAFDPEPNRIVGLLTRRDQESPSDWLKVDIDSYFDKRSAYEFAVNAAGVKRDRYYFNDGNGDDSWDAVWEVKVGRDADGWHAEFRIPFSQLRFNNTTGGPVGFAMIREIGRLNETSTWPLLARSGNGFVSQFGEITGLRMSGAPKRFEILPYTVGKVETQPIEAGNNLAKSPDAGASMGLDVKYAVRPGLTLTATANPDFGQVEADPAVVNLDAFETFFPERRPFFIEGSGTFRFDVDCNDGECTGLFYSRRIGRAPQGAPDVGENEFAKGSDAATIMGAAKLTGRVGRFSVGALSAVTAHEDALVAGANGLNRRSQAVEPATAYTVGRARREFRNQSSLGFMVTSTNRQLPSELSFLASDAVTGGVDYNWRLSQKYDISGYWAGSHVAGSTEAIERLQENNVHAFQRPDATHVELDPLATTLGGHAGSMAFSKIGGERTRFNTNFGYKSPGFDMNDLGFQRRADEKSFGNWLQWRRPTPGRFVRNYNLNLNQWTGWNFDGDRLYAGGNVNMHWAWANNYSSGFGVNFNASPFRDRVTRGGPGVLGNSSWSLWYYGNADNRRAIYPSYNGYHERDGQGTTRHNIGPSLNWRPSSAATLSLGIRYSINNDDAQWVENVTDAQDHEHYVFGRIEQRTMALTARFNYTLTPDLSIQTYAEPFVSAGAYTNFRELADGRAKSYGDRYSPYAYGGSPDFNYRSFRTTNVLRWEYRPGSTLFVVWQQGRQDVAPQGAFDFSRDFGGVFSTPARNVFLVKLSYWLNM
jgi:hypothetical protein